MPHNLAALNNSKNIVMKKCFKKLSAVCIAFTVLFSACTKEKPAADNTTSDSFTANITAGTWVISSFTQRAENKTAQFSDIVFTFNTNNTVKATEKNGSVTNGTWSHTSAVTYYGATSKEAIAINMGTGTPFAKISKTWNVISNSGTVARVDNPEVLEDEHLQFSKQ
jgi:hypothetical protein